MRELACGGARVMKRILGPLRHSGYLHLWASGHRNRRGPLHNPILLPANQQWLANHVFFQPFQMSGRRNAFRKLPELEGRWVAAQYR